ncbi:MAG: MmcQ/YjbR family DNA-binding protein [Actinomycetota bacterium]|nr:MmcQ/YjbR family DNA-binding protein [Actinomycetota bacterium]
MSDDGYAEVDGLRAFARTFPEAWEDTPWDATPVAKVRKKIFVFFGIGERPSVSVKLPESAEQALQAPGAMPTGHGLGRSGWVTVPISGPDAPSRGVVEDWIEESYRTVAPKTLARSLDAARGV